MLEFLLNTGLPLLFLGLFVLCFRLRRTSLATAFFFCGFLCFGFFALLLRFEPYIGTWWYNLLLFFPLAAALLFTSFAGYLVLAFLLLNTRSMVRREGFRLQHVLTLLFAAGVAAFWLALRLVPGGLEQPAYRALVFAACALAAFYFFHLAIYLVNTFLCNTSSPRKNQHYIVILGCGLRKDGTVTPLLAARVDRAIRFYYKQAKSSPPPKLVCSGGKGGDERRSEAEAMADYALGQGIPLEHILLESNSHNTLENMRFSKAVMDEDARGRPYNCIYATSNYHVLRAGVYARRAGLPMRGIGGKTAFYFLGNAFLREYIAYLRMNLKWSIAMAALFFAGSGAAYLLLAERIALWLASITAH
jgi:uncharacterized SAM-binding protein YcdF (DUF218 family)